MQILVQVLFLIIGFFLLIKGADYFVEGACAVAERFHIPQMVIGLTIVAMGTSAPEAAISITAGIKGNVGIAIGNILGSNILNVLLVLGLAALITPLAVQRSTVQIELPFLILITAMLVLLGFCFGRITFGMGVLFWIVFLIFLYYLFLQAKKKQQVEKTQQHHTVLHCVFMIGIGLFAIIYGSDMTVEHASNIAKLIGLSERMIGLTIVAFGTSLPECVTSMIAAKKGKADIAIGNIVGSNIFNILFVLGTTALFCHIPYAKSFLLDGIIATASCIGLWFCVRKKQLLEKKEGLLFLLCYIGYFGYLCFSNL